MKKYTVPLLVAGLILLAAMYVNSLRKEPSVNSPSRSRQNNKAVETYPDFGGPKTIRLLPVDEAGKNADFKQFRDKLLAALKKRDLAFLKQHVNERIKYSFGINNGREGFLREWQLDTNPNASSFWDELQQVLSLGGTFNDKQGNVFTAPYVFTRFPDNLDAFQYAAIIAKNAYVYAQPNQKTKPIGRLSYDIVKVLKRDVGQPSANIGVNGWLNIESLSGHSGFVRESDARSPIDYRAALSNNHGNWELIFFVAGD